MNLTNSVCNNRDQDFSRDISKENQFPYKNIRYTSVDSYQLPNAKFNSLESSSENGNILFNQHNFVSTQCLIKDHFEIGTMANEKSKDNHYIFKPKNYNEFLGLFVEILPKFEKRKDTVMENCIFLKSILEISFY